MLICQLGTARMQIPISTFRIMDLIPKGEIDGAYCIYNNPKLADKSAENYKKAKEHILRLLEKGRCPVSEKSLEVCKE